MFKLRTLAIASVLMLMAVTVSAQFPSYGQTGFGAVLQKGATPMLTGYTSLAQSVFKDTATSISVISREGVFYSDPDSIQTELKGAFIHAAVRYHFEIGTADLYFETGGKVQVLSEEGPDKVGAGMGLTFGAKLFKNLGLQATGDWLPTEGADKYLVSLAIDLFPDL